MNTGRNLNDVFALRAQVQLNGDKDDNEEEEDEAEEEENGEEKETGDEYDHNNMNVRIIDGNGSQALQAPQRQTTLMDMLMNGSRNTTITVGGSSNVSPAILDYMRVTPQQQQQQTNSKSTGSTPNVAIVAENVPLEDMYESRYKERIARISSKIEKRPVDEYDEDGDEDDDRDEDDFEDNNDDNMMNRRSRGSGGDMSDEDDEMMRDLLGMPNSSDNENNNEHNNSRPRKKQRLATTTTVAVTAPTKDSCFLCACGDRFHDGIRVPHIARLNQIIDKFYGRMSNYELANAVHLYFKKYVYNEDEDMHMLEAHVVLEHLEGRHSLAALNFIVESIHDYEQVKFISKGCLCKADGSLDHRAFAIFDKAQTKLEKLYTMNIEKMNFNNGQTMEDLNSKGSYFNLMPMFSQKEERFRRLKRKATAIESATNTFGI